MEETVGRTSPSPYRERDRDSFEADFPVWRERDSFSATALPNGQCLLIGGYSRILYHSPQETKHGRNKDMWLIYSGEN